MVRGKADQRNGFQKYPTVRTTSEVQRDAEELEGWGIWLRRSLGGGELSRRGFTGGSSHS